jgi:hypothetical protein
LAVTRDEPPTPGLTATKLLVAYTGNTAGLLENCGCKINQSGGVARRATVLREVRSRGLPLLLLDAGNAFPTPQTFTPEDPFAIEELALYLSRYRKEGYAAVAVGTSELAWGPEFLSHLQRRSKAPFISALHRAGGQPLAPKSKLATIGSLRIGIVSVFEPPTYRDAQGPFESAAANRMVAEPGLGLDVTFIASVAAAHALAMLEPEGSRTDLLVSDGFTLVHGPSRPRGSLAELFTKPLEMIRARVKRDEPCPVCSYCTTQEKAS